MRITLIVETEKGTVKKQVFEINHGSMEEWLDTGRNISLELNQEKKSLTFTFEQGKRQVAKDTGDKGTAVKAAGNMEIRNHMIRSFSSPRYSELIQGVEMAASTKMNVLISGETGVGKEFIARLIHACGSWKDKPYIPINCGAIPENLLESELFGYDEGAFTGAKKSGKPGKFELAGEGIIFLDEISEMPYQLQVKLLRVLQERQFERVGGIRPIAMNAKVIAATNRNLEQEIQHGRFRLDLFYRLSVLKLVLPPLREHGEDIPGIAEACLRKINEMYGLKITGLDHTACKLLQACSWEGNIRELHNALEFAANVAGEGVIRAEHLSPQMRRPISPDHQKSLNNKVEELEKSEIMRALALCEGNKIKAAEMLGMIRSSFYNKLSKYGID